MNELFPVVSGLVIGLLAGLLQPSLRVGVAVLLSVGFGFVATVASGEFRISWGLFAGRHPTGRRVGWDVVSWRPSRPPQPLLNTQHDEQPSIRC
jgi:hypothetical protein